ncbi:MAG TPA: ATP-binding protein [Thermoanaerobaculia bacterium]|nr:ATP-binding protein [Thermoanaerobaculia bacterium]
MPIDRSSETSHTSLFRKLAEGWDSLHDGVTQAFLQSWRKRISYAELKEVGHCVLYFLTDLPEIHLLGTDDVHVLLLAGTSDDAEILKAWKRKVGAPRRLLLSLVLSEQSLPVAREIFAGERALVLSLSEARYLLESSEPGQEFKRMLRARLPIRSLIPYNYLRPAYGQLFFGRQQELGRLLHEDDVSFAIAGPSRIGKTSLIHEYQRILKRRRDPRALRLFEIDFYACSNTTSSQEVARFFAMKIDSSSRSHRMTCEGLIDFLRYQLHERGGALELVLDEVDEVCAGAAFDVIGEAAKQGLCRLIVCGRGRLFKMLLSKDSPLACRLELLRPGPLEDEEAKALLFLPLRDLGIEVNRPDEVAAKVFKLTGRLPHLLQFYGKKIAECAAEEPAAPLTLEMIEALSWDMDTAHYVTSLLRVLDTPGLRLLALALLKENPPEITVATARAVVSRWGMQLSHTQMTDLLNELVINSVLSWKRGVFSISINALPTYAARLGYLDDGLTEAIAQFAAGRDQHPMPMR